MKRSPFLVATVIFFVLIALFFLTSCSKSNLPVTQTWIVQEGHDNQNLGHAVFCDSADYGKIDTIKITFNKEPNDPNKFNLTNGSIYFHPGKSVDGDRNYCELLKQIN